MLKLRAEIFFSICIFMLAICACNPNLEAASNAVDVAPSDVCLQTKKIFASKYETNKLLDPASFETKSGFHKLEGYAWVDAATEMESYLEGKSASNIPPKVRNAALMAAAVANSPGAATQILMHSKVDDLPTADAIVSASECGSLAVVNTLLNAGVSPNVQASSGADAMMMALINNHAEVAERLIEAGYDSCQTRTAKDESVRDLANRLGETRLAERMKHCDKP